MLAMSWLNTEAWQKAPLLRDDPERGSDAALQFAYGMRSSAGAGPSREAEKILAGLLDHQAIGGPPRAPRAGPGRTGEGRPRHRNAPAEPSRRTRMRRTRGRRWVRSPAARKAPEALAHLEAAARLTPGDAAVRDQLAQAYQELAKRC